MADGSVSSQASSVLGAALEASYPLCPMCGVMSLESAAPPVDACVVFPPRIIERAARRRRII